MIKKIQKILLSPDALYLVVAITFIWFITKLWLPPGYTVAGHDSGLALNARGFLETRLYAWDAQDFGHDNSPHFGSLVLHTIDYLSSRLAGVPYAGNQILIFFWLSAVLLSGYILATELQRRSSSLVKYLFPTFITLNFLILQSVFIIERAKYSVLVATLLVLTLLLRHQAGRIGTIVAATAASLVLTIFNSGSLFGVPLYGSLAVIISAFLFTETVNAVKNKKYRNLRKFLSFIILTFVITSLLNSYALFPYAINFFANDISRITSENTITPNRAWLDSLSQATSLLNIFRWQGVPDWYAAEFTANPGHAYASAYLQNPLLVIFSFIIPIVAFSGLVVRKSANTKRTLLLFAFLSLFSMIFVAGTHEPLGSVYGLLYDYVPGFSIFRSPYFKFGSTYLIGMSALLAVSLSLGAKKIQSFLEKAKMSHKLGGRNLEKTTKLGTVLLISTIWILYHFVIFFPGRMFTWQQGLSTRLQPPGYVAEFDNWIKSNHKDNTRILLLPPAHEEWKNDGYQWGYWSLSPLQGTLSSRSFLANDHALSGEEKAWTEALYGAIKLGKYEEIIQTASLLNVGYFLVRHDTLSDESWSAGPSVEDYENIKSHPEVVKVSTLEKWELYSIKNHSAGEIVALTALSSVPENNSYLGREFLKNTNYVVDKLLQTYPSLENNIANKISSHTCQSCLLEQRDALTSLPAPRILPNSPLYRFKIAQEESTLKNSGTDQQKMDNYLGFVLRRTAEVKTMIDTEVEETHIVKNLKATNSYLDQAYALLQEISQPDTDFSRTRQLLDILNPIEKFLKGYVSSHEFGNNGEEFRQQVFGVLWRITKMKKYYSPLLQDPHLLSNQKIYFLNLDPKIAGDNHLYIRTSTLPKSAIGEPILPQKSSFEKETEQKALTIDNYSSEWKEILLPDNSLTGKGTLKLQFSDLPDLYRQTGSGVEDFPTGVRACYYGTISQFNPNRLYRVEVSTPVRDQSLRIFFKETESTGNKPHGYLSGQDETDVLIPQFGEPFTYTYFPSRQAKFSKIYFCSGNKNLPVDAKLAIYEIFSPEVISTSTKNILPNIPTVTFTKQNPTKYTVNVKNAPKAFILRLNQQYSNLWRLKEQKPEENIIEDFQAMKSAQEGHFEVNGYSNAWLIEKTGDYSVSLEYLPQKFFYYGLAVSALTFGMITVFLGHRLYGKAKRRRN